MLQIDVCLEGVVVHIVFKLIYCWNIKDFEVVYHERVFVCVLSWIIHLNRLLEGLRGCCICFEICRYLLPKLPLNLSFNHAVLTEIEIESLRLA